MQRRNDLFILIVLSVFTAVRHFGSIGEDLSSSYYSCKLLAAHQESHLYSRDALDFSLVNDSSWDRLARETGFTPLSKLHPFVQIPLWAFSQVSFLRFNQIFLFLLSISLSGTIWIIARYLAPRTYHFGWIAVVCFALYLSEAYKHTMILVQTQAIFILMIVAAVVLARNKQAVWAGALLALAAAVKVTPGLLLIYWLVTRQWRASASFVGFSALLFLASIVSTGWALNTAYLHNLAQLSNMLLVAWNNQSLAAVWMGPHYPASEELAWHALPLPRVVKLTSMFLSIACALAGGFMDLRLRGLRPDGGKPYGAAFALLGITIFATVAWTHYYVLLLLPLMLMLDSLLAKRSLLILAVVLSIITLNLDTYTAGGILQHICPFHVVRAQFWSAVICMLGLVFLAVQQRTAAVLRQRSTTSIGA